MIVPTKWWIGVYRFFAAIALFGVLLLVVCHDTKHFHGIEPEEDATNAQKLFNRCYFVANHVTTGSGDIVPATFRARVVTFFFFLWVVLQISVLLTQP